MVRLIIGRVLELIELAHIVALALLHFSPKLIARHRPRERLVMKHGTEPLVDLELLLVLGSLAEAHIGLRLGESGIFFDLVHFRSDRVSPAVISVIAWGVL